MDPRGWWITAFPVAPGLRWRCQARDLRKSIKRDRSYILLQDLDFMIDPFLRSLTSLKLPHCGRGLLCLYSTNECEEAMISIRTYVYMHRDAQVSSTISFSARGRTIKIYSWIEISGRERDNNVSYTITLSDIWVSLKNVSVIRYINNVLIWYGYGGKATMDFVRSAKL